MSNECQNIICRYCLGSQIELASELIFPCNCKTPVCAECLLKHIEINNKTTCEICQIKFDKETYKSYETTLSILESSSNFDDDDDDIHIDIDDDDSNMDDNRELLDNNLNTHRSDNTSYSCCTAEDIDYRLLIFMILILLFVLIIYKDDIKIYIHRWKNFEMSHS